MTQNKRRADLEIEGAQLILGLRNFSGRETKFSPAGKRTFAIALSREDAEALAMDGWNIKTLKPREGYEEDGETYFLSVKVSFSVVPPKIFLVTDEGTIPVTEETVSLLDSADILQADVVINPYPWTVNGKDGIAAYLKAMYVTIQEDRFAKKYRI